VPVVDYSELTDYTYTDYDYADYASACTGLGVDNQYITKGTKISTDDATSFNDCALMAFEADGGSFNYDTSKNSCTVFKESWAKVQKFLKPKSTMMAGYPNPENCK
jgi:CRISPR/Cas system type I-B associated protein Csh2 (Cas7 group RAMP superfamily)